MSKAVIHLSSLDVCQEVIGWSRTLFGHNPEYTAFSHSAHMESFYYHTVVLDGFFGISICPYQFILYWFKKESYSNFSRWRMFKSSMLIRYFVDIQYNVSVVSTWFLLNLQSSHVGPFYCGSGRICEEFTTGNYCRILWLFFGGLVTRA